MRLRTTGAFLGVCSLAALLAAGGCGGGGGGTDVDEASLIGIWRNIRISANGESANCPGELIGNNGQSIRLCGNNDTIEFQADGDLIAFGVAEDSLLRSRKVVKRQQRTRHEGEPHLTRVRGSWEVNGGRLDLFIDDIATDENDNGSFESGEILDIEAPVEGEFQISLPSSGRMVIRYRDEESGIQHEDTYEEVFAL